MTAVCSWKLFTTAARRDMRGYTRKAHCGWETISPPRFDCQLYTRPTVHSLRTQTWLIWSNAFSFWAEGREKERSKSREKGGMEPISLSPWSSSFSLYFLHVSHLTSSWGERGGRRPSKGRRKSAAAWGTKEKYKLRWDARGLLISCCPVFQ